MTTSIFYRVVVLVSFALFLCACVKSRNFDTPDVVCSGNLTANTTYAQVKSLYDDETIQIFKDLIVEGYVISSDKSGNFFSVLYFQDHPKNPDEGFQIEIDMRDSHLFYPVGSKIFIKLNGLYLGKSKDVYKLGGTFTSFGNVSVGRLPATMVNEHIFVSCGASVDVEPTQVLLDSLHHDLTNTLVQFDTVEIYENQLGQTYAIEGEETEKILIDCDDNELTMVNSGFSDFQDEILPEANGTITGVLLRENENYRLAIRNLEDINFTNERCEELIDEFTSQNVFISELADPDNNSGARFVELYNAASESLSLKGWQLRRYTNANTDVSSKIDLSNLVIGGQSTLVIAPNALEFQRVYGFVPDLEVGTNSPADSNGDDNLELLDPFGKIIDTFGLIGEDGTGTNHEFEDGRAVRNVTIYEGSATYNFVEWTIYNDSGESETMNQPQNAPQDFTPGQRE